MARVGIKDIAHLAGVSIATVSRTLRNPQCVAAATREKVLCAVEVSGYTPNNLGVSLRTSKSKNIVVIIPDVSDSFNSGLIKALEHVAHKSGYSILLGDTQGKESLERSFGDMVKSRQADGIISFSHRLPFHVDHENPNIEPLPPLVNSCESVPFDGIPRVLIDNIAAAKEATNYLLSLGHKEIAVITGDMNTPSSRDRLAGYRQALYESEIELNLGFIKYGSYTVEDGEKLASELIALDDKPSAIFCFSDEIALGCYHSLSKNRLNVPKDMSIIGFDDSKFSRYFSPPLTTIAQPVTEIGIRCMSLLIELIEDKKPAHFDHILPHKLIIRDSTQIAPELRKKVPLVSYKDNNICPLCAQI